MHTHQQNHWNDILFYQWTIEIVLYPARPRRKIIWVPLMRCILTNRTIGMTSFTFGTNPTIGTNGPSVWRIVSVCVYWTSVEANNFASQDHMFDGDPFAIVFIEFSPRFRSRFLAAGQDRFPLHCPFLQRSFHHQKSSVIYHLDCRWHLPVPGISNTLFPTQLYLQVLKKQDQKKGKITFVIDIKQVLQYNLVLSTELITWINHL